MDDLERLLIERECTRLITEYAKFVDYVDPMKAGGLLTDDGSLVLNNRHPSVTMSGRKELDAGVYQKQQEAVFNGRLLQWHVLSNIIVDVKDSEHASSETRVMLFVTDWDSVRGAAPTVKPHIFRWEDEYVRTREGWRISRHTCTPMVFMSPELEARWSRVFPYGSFADGQR